MLARAIARRVCFAVAVVGSLTMAGCSSPAVCNCPVSAGLFRVPAADSNPIVGASTDPPCTAMPSGSIYVWVALQDSGTCRVKAHLKNGDAYTFSVEFRATASGCCGNLAYPIDASVPVLVDGGTD